MKKLMLGLFFGCLLLGSASITSAAGVKEPVYPPDGPYACWVSPPGSELWYPCGSEDAFLANCIRLMEVNMKSIDPYLPFIETGTKFTPEEEKKYNRALALWNQVKHDCWKEYEEERQHQAH